MRKDGDSALRQINPDTLMRLYLRVSIISLAVIISLASYGTYRVYLSHIVAEAERSAVALANALTEAEKEHLLVKSAAGEESLQVTAASVPTLNRDLGMFFRQFNILKIKIFDSNARILYSNDPSIIGKSDPENLRLKNTLAGNNDSKVEKKEKILDFHGTEKFSVDVVETYVPVRDSRGAVIGSFELYQDVTHYKRAVWKMVGISALMLSLILFWVFTISFIVLRKEAVQLKQIQEVLNTHATTDFLTGVCNRRQLLLRCDEELSLFRRLKKEQRLESCIGFIMVDIDHFKRINDIHGHEAGDAVISDLAQRLKENIRHHDIIGRYGGEEFLVIVPHADQEQLRNVAERLWRSVREAAFDCRGQKINVTISLGVAATREAEDSYEEIIRRADDALYRSKNAGRDRITYA
jgi:diguanylate cyclase (GGDEF)-like protein